MIKIIKIVPIIAAILLISCGGGGCNETLAFGKVAQNSCSNSSINKSIESVTVIGVAASSYENKMKASDAEGLFKIFPFINGDGGDWISTGYALADFLQNGTFTLVTSSLKMSSGAVTPDVESVIKFWQYKNNQWVDISELLIKDQTGCINPRKAMIADINGDKKPDVIFACTGYDAPPFPGEHQRVLVSTQTGKYNNLKIPVNAYAHGGSVVDMEGAGYSDLIYTDTTITENIIYLKNNKDGTFVVDPSKIPSDLKNKPVYSLEFVQYDNDGKFDLWVAGASGFDLASINPRIYINDGNGGYSHLNQVVLSPSKSKLVSLDLVKTNEAIYIWYATNDTGGYDGVYLEEFTKLSINGVKKYSHNGKYQGSDMVWSPWIYKTKDYNLISPPSDLNYAAGN